MRPLLSYYGGKQRLASQLVRLMPPHTVYVEPFCGGAALLFAKPQPFVTNNHHYLEVLNDRDERLITLYRVCQDAGQRRTLEERLHMTPFSRAEYVRAQQILQTWETHTAVDQAWAMVLQLQQSFAHKVLGGWRTAVISTNDAATWATYRAALPTLMDRLQNVHLECDDALAVIRRWDSPQTLIYCDPPYVGTAQGHYQGYTEADLHALVAVLDTCQSSVMLSSYAHACIPTHWPVYQFEAFCSVSGQGKIHRQGQRDRASTPEERGDRRRVEHCYVIDRSAAVRHELRGLLIGQTQLGLFEET